MGSVAGGKASSRAGIPNKRTSDMLKKLEEMYPGYDPVLQMAGIAQTATLDRWMLDLLVRVHNELAAIADTIKKPERKKEIIELANEISHAVDRPQADIEHRLVCMKEVANYMHPKRKAIELSSDPDNPVDLRPQVALVVGMPNGKAFPIDLSNTVDSEDRVKLPEPVLTVVQDDAE